MVYVSCKNVIKVHPDITGGMLTFFKILFFFLNIIVQNLKVSWVNLHMQHRVIGSPVKHVGSTIVKKIFRKSQTGW